MDRITALHPSQVDHDQLWTEGQQKKLSTQNKRARKLRMAGVWRLIWKRETNQRNIRSILINFFQKIAHKSSTSSFSITNFFFALLSLSSSNMFPLTLFNLMPRLWHFWPYHSQLSHHKKSKLTTSLCINLSLFQSLFISTTNTHHIASDWP